MVKSPSEILRLSSSVSPLAIWTAWQGRVPAPPDPRGVLSIETHGCRESRKSTRSTCWGDGSALCVCVRVHAHTPRAERAPKTRHEEHLPRQESLQAFEEHAKPSFQKTTLERSCVLADATPGQPGSEPGAGGGLRAKGLCAQDPGRSGHGGLPRFPRRAGTWLQGARSLRHSVTRRRRGEHRAQVRGDAGSPRGGSHGEGESEAQSRPHGEPRPAEPEGKGRVPGGSAAGSPARPHRAPSPRGKAGVGGARGPSPPSCRTTTATTESRWTPGLQR